MKKHAVKFLGVIVVVSTILSCNDGAVKPSKLEGKWEVKKVVVNVNDKDYDVPTDNFDSNYKGVTHTFNSDGTYIFKDTDGSLSNGKWTLDDANNEVTIDYPEEDYSEIYKVVSSSSSELVLKTPEVVVEKAETDQDYSTLLSAYFLLFGTDAENITPEKVSITFTTNK